MIWDLEAMIVQAKVALLKSSEQKLLELNQRLLIKKGSIYINGTISREIRTLHGHYKLSNQRYKASNTI